MGYPRGVLHVLKGTAFELSPYAVLCTRVYTVVYPRVHCCIHACRQRRSLLLRLGALLNSINRLFSALQLAFSRHRPYVPINNVPACEAGGNLRCDLELWGEMHYLCRRKSKRGGAQRMRRTRRKRRREGGDVCEKICGEVWWFGKKQYLCNRKTKDGWPEVIVTTTTYKRSLR